MFIIKKIFNNNVLLAEDEQKKEFVFMGKGIGFSKSADEMVDEKAIQKKFQLETTNQAHVLGKFLADLDESYFKTIKEIVDYAKEKLGIPLSDYIYFSLTDHISYAIERNKEGVVFRNPIQWEIKKAYAKEYEIGRRALEIIEKNLNVTLPQEEIASIAMHVINASQQNSDFKKIYEELDLIQDITRIIKLHFLIEFEEESVNFERFMIHLKFFVHRLRTNKQLTEANDEFYRMAVKQWPDTYDCVMKIMNLVYQNKNIRISNEEVFYLMLHINRLTNRD